MVSSKQKQACVACMAFGLHVQCIAAWSAGCSHSLLSIANCLLPAADPFLNDQNYILSVLSLEELGATGNKGLAGIVGNPVLSQAIAGLATSATAQATLERVMLFDLKDKIIEPFGETAQQVFARISALRDSLDGPQVIILPDVAISSCSCSTWRSLPSLSLLLPISYSPQLHALL